MKLKIDFHTHTDRSIDGVSTIGQMIESARKKGLDAIAITDHNICSNDIFDTNNDVLLIPGCEISTLEGHIVGVFLKDNIDVGRLWNRKLPSVEEAVQEIHNKGGVAILAHPFASNSKISSKEHLADIVDGVEVKNARACFKNIRANDMAQELAHQYNLICIGGSDGHSKAEVGNAYTIVDCQDKSLESIEQAVRLSKTRVVLIKNTPHFRKGISQFYKSLRAKNKLKVFKSTIYFAYCVSKDFYDVILGILGKGKN